MALGENPKKIAADVAEGMRTFNKANLRRLDAADLRILADHLQAHQKIIRIDVVPMDDPNFTEKTKVKNRQMSRIRNALTIIRAFVYRRGIKGVF